MVSVPPDTASSSGGPLTAASLDILQGASLACRFFGLIFGQEPAEDLLRALNDQCLLEEWPLGDADARSRKGVALIRIFLAQPGARPYELARRDYTELFLGPEHPLKQWESVWTTQDRLLFGDSAIEVAEIYTRHGFVVQTQEPGDHIAIECGFLAELLGLIVQSAENGEAGEVARLTFEVRDFLEQHLGNWAEYFLEELERRAATDFYRGVAMLCRATLDAIHNELGAMR